MKKSVKITLISLLSVFVVAMAVLAIIFFSPPSVAFDENKLKCDQNVTILDCNGQKIEEIKKGKNYVTIQEIPQHTINAFIASEDKNFYKHNGVDLKRIVAATFTNIKNRSFSQGGSTISQQLIKNTHLKNQKTIKRKLDEIKLTRILEKKYSKDQILEMYLNTIYFGENCYGIANATEKYFSKTPSELTINESALLCAVIKAPSRYNPIKNFELANRHKNVVLERMNKENYLDNQNVKTLKNQDITLNINRNYVTNNSYLLQVYDELDDIFSNKEFLLKSLVVYTDFDKSTQELLSKQYDGTTDYQAVCLDNEKRTVVAFYSNGSAVKRAPASTVKPWLIYAPSIEEGLINQYTLINDEKTDFQGYCPKNFNDKYSGQVSAKYALSNSLNVPAVKLLDMLTIKKAKRYASLMDVDIKSDSLTMALGNFENDMYLKDIAACFTVFPNYGQYANAHFIKKITDIDGKIMYEHKQNEIRVFSEGTSSIINEMLADTATNGTCKKLNKLNMPVYAKTGTNGDKNGNLDAYCVSYTNDKTLAVWNGFFDGSYMDNSMTGAKLPTQAVYNVFTELYSQKKSRKIPDKGTIELVIDKYSYEKNNEFLLADENTPQKYRLTGKFTDKNKPEKYSAVFNKPIIKNPKISIEDNVVKIECSDNKLYKYIIKRNSDGNEKIVYDGNENFSDKLSIEGTYEYTITPYIKIGTEKIYGQCVTLPKVKYSSKKADEFFDDWWSDIFR